MTRARFAAFFAAGTAVAGVAAVLTASSPTLGALAAFAAPGPGPSLRPVLRAAERGVGRPPGQDQPAGRTAPRAAITSPVLTSQDKELLGLALRLKRLLGEEVWPGLGAADIPVIVYNDAFEFLTGAATPPPTPWTRVEGDLFAAAPYYRRKAATFQSFAVEVSDAWVASISSLDRMSARMPIRIDAGLYVAAVLHEIFHAFQADRAPARFHRVLTLYGQESSYPASDPDFAKAWTREGELLTAALKALGAAGAAGAPDAADAGPTAPAAQAVDDIRLFLDSRRDRLAAVPFGFGVRDYESEMEWLEGLGKYVEVRFYRLAAARARAGGPDAGEPGLAAFKAGPPYFASDLARLEKRLGSLPGDQRFYLSGMAEAMILDRLFPGWKNGFFREGGSLEDRLRAAVEPS